MKNSEVSKIWNRLDADDQLEIIENAIDGCNVNEGSLMLRLFAKDKSIQGYIQAGVDNHLCVEAVSQATLSELFSDDYDFEEEDAQVILNWMNAQLIMEFTFWKENRLDQEYKLALEEIKAKYKEYLATKEQSWIEYYGHQTVTAFVDDKDGLNSVMDAENYEVLQEQLKEVRWAQYA